MANVITCDMCGNPIKKCYERRKTILKRDRGLLWIDLSDLVEYDLCTSCALKVKDFIENSSSNEVRDA